MARITRNYEESYRAENKFKVPKKMWGSWTLVAKHTFNKLYEDMIKSPDLYHHPKAILAQQVPEKEIWKTTAWNAAFMAACIVSRGERHILKDLSNKVKGK